MKRQYILIIIAVCLCLLSCSKDKKGNIEGGIFLHFEPERCDKIETFVKTYISDQNGMKQEAIPNENDNIVYSNFFLSIKTNQTDNTDFIHETSVEEELRKNIEYVVYSSAVPTKTYMRRTYYRTTGITDFRIRTVNTPLFGIAAGGELRDYFKIIDYVRSPYVISYDTKNIMYNAIKPLPNEISGWLGLHPMAHPEMQIAFKSAPAELPVKVQFVIEMVTVDGKIISSTTNPVTLTK